MNGVRIYLKVKDIILDFVQINAVVFQIITKIEIKNKLKTSKIHKIKFSKTRQI